MDVLEAGLAALFPHADARYDASLGLFASKEFLASGHVREKVVALQSTLVADTYGGVDTIAWARDAYNSRTTLFSVFWIIYHISHISR